MSASFKFDTAPCKGCPDRKLGCHIRCKKYIAFIRQKSEIRRIRMEEGRIDSFLRSFRRRPPLKRSDKK